MRFPLNWLASNALIYHAQEEPSVLTHRAGVRSVLQNLQLDSVHSEEVERQRLELLQARQRSEVVVRVRSGLPQTLGLEPGLGPGSSARSRQRARMLSVAEGCSGSQSQQLAPSEPQRQVRVHTSWPQAVYSSVVRFRSHRWGRTSDHGVLHALQCVYGER